MRCSGIITLKKAYRHVVSDIKYYQTCVKLPCLVLIFGKKKFSVLVALNKISSLFLSLPMFYLYRFLHLSQFPFCLPLSCHSSIFISILVWVLFLSSGFFISAEFSLFFLIEYCSSIRVGQAFCWKYFLSITAIISHKSHVVVVSFVVCSFQAMKKICKACVKYPEWKQRHNPAFKPWLYPEQTTLPSIPLSELSIQRAESLENIDESSLAEAHEREDSD